jgi:hypothetical protein
MMALLKARIAKKKISRFLQNRQKLPYLCSPLQPEATRRNEKVAERNKNFPVEFGKSESLLTFALPIAEGLANGKKKGVTYSTHTVTSTGSSTRSLNDGNRQNSKCLTAFG